MICASFAITLNSVSILAAGDWMPSLPEFDLSVDGEDQDFIGAAYKEPVGRGNQLNAVSWTRVLRYSSLTELKSALTSFQSATPKAGALVINSVTYPKARLLSARCKQSEVDALWLIQTFSVVYGGAAS